MKLPDAPAVGHRAKERGFDEAEHGGVGADAQCEGENGDRREAAVSQQRGKGMASVTDQRIHTRVG